LPVRIKDFLKVVVFFGVGFVILYLVYASQNTAFQEQCRLDGIPDAECSLAGKVWSDLKSVNFIWLILVLVAFNISNFSRAYRWKMMMDSLGYTTKTSNAFFSIMIGYFGNLGLPRAGEIFRATIFSKYEKIRVEKIVGTVVLDRMVDMISVLVVVAIAIAIEYDILWGFISSQGLGAKEWPSWIFYLPILGFAFLTVLWIFRNKLLEIRIVQKVMALLLGFMEGVKSIKQIKRPVPFFLHTVNIWFMYFLMTYLCFFAFEPTSHLSAYAGLVVFVFGTFGVIIPSPGGMGTFHALAIIALSIYGIAGDDAFSFANILFFSVQIGCSVLLGLIAIGALPWINRNYKPVRPGVFDENIQSNQI